MDNNKLTLNINNKKDGSSNNNINNSIKNDEKKIRIDFYEDVNDTQKISSFIVINNPNSLIENKNNNNSIKQIIEKADLKYYEFTNYNTKIEKPLQNINESLVSLVYLAEKIKEYDETKENDKNNKEKLDKLNKEIKDKINDINKKQIELSYDLEENKHLTITKNLNFHSISYSKLDNDSLRYDSGVVYLNNGDRYEGKFKNNKKEGRGIYYYKNGKKSYKGDFLNDRFNGKGIISWNGKKKYEGEFVNDLKEGKGIYYFSDGGRYEGEFKNDKKEGKGIYYFNDSDRRYECNWENDKKEGVGIHYYGSSEIEIGEFTNDCFHSTLSYSKDRNEIKIHCEKNYEIINDSNIVDKKNEKYKDNYHKLKEIIQQEKEKEKEKQQQLQQEIENKIKYISSDNNNYEILFNKLFDTDNKQQYMYKEISSRLDTYKVVFLDDNNNNKNLYLQFNKNRYYGPTSFYIGTMSDDVELVFNGYGDYIGEDSNIDDTQSIHSDKSVIRNNNNKKFKGFIINKNSNDRNNNKQVIYVGSNESWQIHKTWGNKDDFFNLLEEMDTPVCCRSPLKKLYIKRFNEHIDLVKGIKDKDQQITLNK